MKLLVEFLSLVFLKGSAGVIDYTINSWESVDPTCIRNPCDIADGSPPELVRDCLDVAPMRCEYEANYNVSGIIDQGSRFCHAEVNGVGWWAIPISDFYLPFYLNTEESTGGRGWMTIRLNPITTDDCTYTVSDVIDFGNFDTCGIPATGPTTSVVVATLSRPEAVFSIDFRLMKKYISRNHLGLVTSKASTDCGQAVREMRIHEINYRIKAQGRSAIDSF
eukprot:Protomagalhaensia_wolfi_Nauph_80__2464@NODE_2635_length_1032_cov_439_041289_g2064_i0_p1_GENE_NODE_2635_length_1032_cov_439_041289_g2064_i0NODE_2635_length_1032_cov_439_041289_g2064_i0_p1_ORF_typecomplete_len221_score42_01_NODE_2635_length_1032_cov_439_041289_g2064_i0307969